MSRSKKKPYMPVCCVGKGKAMRKVKRQYNRELRRILNQDEDSPYLKRPKLIHNRWTWPDDGKWYRPELEKAWRK